jgi:hypothetical protein
MANMTLIQAITVGAGGAAAMDFTSIPQTYTDLKIVISARNTSTSGNESQILLTVNGNGSNGSWRLLYGTGSGVFAGNNSGYLQPAHAPSANTTANTFGNAEIYFPNYTSSSAYKSFSSDFATENNTTSALIGIYANLWSSNSAITQLTLTSNASNFVQYTTAYLYGIESAAVGAKATGGNIISQDANYYYHTFTSSGTFTPTQSLTADYLVVAGGGGGSDAGGGGAGGLRCTVTATGGGGTLETPLSLTATAYTVTIGAGGAGGPNNGTGVSGSNSVFSTITSTGGGNGGNYAANNAGTGGSGGGGGTYSDANPNTGFVGGSGTTNQGYAGGTGYTGTAPSGGAYAGAGGGGAGAIGSNAAVATAGTGGNGVAVSMPVNLITYAGGGGGGAFGGNNSAANGANGGTGGGGNGGTDGGSNSRISTAGSANTGGGGGGGSSDINANAGPRAGGSGIVIVRYAK